MSLRRRAVCAIVDETIQLTFMPGRVPNRAAWAGVTVWATPPSMRAGCKLAHSRA